MPECVNGHPVGEHHDRKRDHREGRLDTVVILRRRIFRNFDFVDLRFK